MSLRVVEGEIDVADAVSGVGVDAGPVDAPQPGAEVDVEGIPVQVEEGLRRDQVVRDGPQLGRVEGILPVVAKDVYSRGPSLVLGDETRPAAKSGSQGSVNFFSLM